MWHPIKHFRTITEHRNMVMRYCFKVGLYRQGLLHDLSKYGPTEFWRGAKFYQGDRSPNDEERRQTGITLAWIHHKGRNKHHLEYWTDYRLQPDGSVRYEGCPMPIRYIAESFCDRIAASRIYLKDKYTDDAPYQYFTRSKKRVLMHADSMRELERMLEVLKDEGEEAALAYVRKRIKQGGHAPSLYY